MIPTQFVPTFPCFGLFAEDCRGPYLVKSASGIALLLLTDDDLLDRFRNENGAVGPVIRIDSAPQLILFLDSLPQNVTHVAFDPNVAGKATTVVAGELYKKLLGS
jgi:hypothetical protein